MSDRRSFLKAGLAGVAAVPVLSNLAGCQTAPSRPAASASTAGTPAGSQAARVGAMSTAKITERVSVISNTPGNVIVLNTGDGLLLVDSGSAQLASAVQKSLGGAKVRTLFN